MVPLRSTLARCSDECQALDQLKLNGRDIGFISPNICMVHTCIIDDSIQTPSKQLHALLDELLTALTLQLSSSL